MQTITPTLSLVKRFHVIARAQEFAWEAGEMSRIQAGRTEWNDEDVDIAAYAMKLILLHEEP